MTLQRFRNRLRSEPHAYISIALRPDGDRSHRRTRISP